jgi:hypothetical protein
VYYQNKNKNAASPSPKTVKLLIRRKSVGNWHRRFRSIALNLGKVPVFIIIRLKRMSISKQRESEFQTQLGDSMETEEHQTILLV